MFKKNHAAAAAGLLLASSSAMPLQAQSAVLTPGRAEVSFSALWIFANLSYAGMRAQGKGSRLWRILSFLGGFPGTLITLLVVQEGGEHAYGVDLPAKR